MTTAAVKAAPPVGYLCPCSITTPAGPAHTLAGCCCPPNCQCDAAAKAGLHGMTEREREIGRRAYIVGFASGAAAC